MKPDKFAGPVFIVGLPRSGTKLLRDLLNRNPQIGIPSAETYFIPYFIKRFGNPPDFRNEKVFSRFYQEFTQTTFFWWQKQNGRILFEGDLEKLVDRGSWRSVFEFILRFYAPKGRNRDFIWGDKTPSYLIRLNLLKELYPKARFVHIIRDPRDLCLSVKRTWGRHLYRAAHNWRKRIETARTDSSRFRQDYMEMFYESLLEDPHNTIGNICDFLGCEFTPSMTTLEKPSENLGDTRGHTIIVRDNKKKYLNHLSPSEIKRIEEITYRVIQSTPYECEYEVEFRPLSPPMLWILRLYDGWVFAKFQVLDKGLCGGLRFFVRLFRENNT